MLKEVCDNNNIRETPIPNTTRTSRYPVDSEARLTELWGRAHRLCEFLETPDGYRYRAVHPGVQNTSADPDFQGAVLENSDVRPIVGDIELPIAARDWYSHNHHADANYNSVVLHVVINGGSDRTTFQQPEMISPGAKFPDIALLESGGPPHLSFDCISGLGIEDIGNMLDTLGDKRFSARSHGFELELSASENPDQVLYAL